MVIFNSFHSTTDKTFVLLLVFLKKRGGAPSGALPTFLEQKKNGLGLIFALLSLSIA